ncbi:gluconokinase [Tsukamurella serpentis]
MGVSGSGKSTVGAGLASRLGRSMSDGDDFHTAAARAKMAAGTALTDDDRRPWLTAIGAHLRAETVAGRSTVMACSALRRCYRDRIRAGGASVFFVLLDGDEDLLRRRIEARTGHFMPATLLASQLRTLEPLGEDEFGARIAVDGPLHSVVGAALSAFAAARVPGAG